MTGARKSDGEKEVGEPLGHMEYVGGDSEERPPVPDMSQFHKESWADSLSPRLMENKSRGALG